MEKTLKLRSHSLSLLNESLRKLILTDEVKKVLPVIVEADGKFSSIVKTNDDFDPSSLDSNIEATDETEENKETKQQLLNKASDSLKQTLQNSKELDEILKKIKKLSEDDGFNEWVVNDKGNTATLKSKNAYIFKQNDNLCLSHNGKIELFKSVSELRQWLQDNNYPLPNKNIEIHESVVVEDKKKDSSKKVDSASYSYNWWDQKREREGKDKTTDHYLNDLEKVYPTLSDEQTKKLKQEIKNVGYPNREQWLALKTLSTNDYNKARLADIKADIEGKGKDRDDRLERSLGKPMPKQPLNVKDEKPIPLKRVRLDIPKDTDLDECFAGITTSGLGSAVTYLGNKKHPSKHKIKKEDKDKEKLEEEIKDFFGNKVKSLTQATEPIYSMFRDRSNKLGTYKDFLNNPNSIYRNSEALQKVLDYFNTNEGWARYKTSRKQDNRTDRSISKLVKEALDEIIYPQLQAVDPSITKDQMYIMAADNLLTNEDGSIDTKNLQAIEDYLKNKASNYNFSDDIKLTDPQLFVIEKGILYPKKSGPNFKFYKALTQGFLKDSWKNNSDELVKNRIKNYLSGKVTSSADYENMKNNNLFGDNEEIIDTNIEVSNPYNLSNEDILLLKRYNMKSDDPKALDFLKVAKSVAESTDVKLNIAEAASKYSWLNKLTGKRLVEDDSPADFATGSPLTGNTPAASPENAPADTQPQGIDLAGEAEDAGFDPSMGGDNNSAGGFGDVDISVGGGYEPEGEGDEQAMSMPPAPEQKIIDVLSNEDNPTDIKVKIQDQDTKKTEIKDLDEIDV